MHEYIDELKSHLTELTAEEQLDVINFYTEYLAGAGIETYAAAVDKLARRSSWLGKCLLIIRSRLAKPWTTLVRKPNLSNRNVTYAPFG
ncbi:DUF1700 domain-containing protein [Pediococcus acidilactici]|uniref:hypothetical protein n=1 Tax=Pediococcus acidilactici TaxID=1254 RepID=UPI001CCD2053|nr:hypothetical protein [Pediococcus acidilactici]